MSATYPTHEVTHVLAWYSKEDGSLIGDQVLDGIDMAELRSAFRPPESDPLMYDSYPVSEGHGTFLRKAVNKPIDLKHYDYFVECEGNKQQMHA
jgi:hypothetical protein